MGNHDLHLLAVAHGNSDYLGPKDTLTPILEAPDSEELLTWLRYRPFLHHAPDFGLTMIHAGIPPQWDLLQARQYATEIEKILRGSKYKKYLANLYGDNPKKWSDKLTEWEKLRFITNCLTRLRYCNAKGKLALKKREHLPMMMKINLGFCGLTVPVVICKLFWTLVNPGLLC